MLQNANLSRLILILFFSHVFAGYCQYFDSGQDPSSLKWKQVKTNNFRIVCPQDFETEAIRFSQLLETALPEVSASSGHSLRRRFPVLIHNYSSLSNGMVSWAPRRFDVYPLPPQSNYPQDWLEQLAIHELRHVIQLDRMSQGVSRWMNIILGEQFSSLIAGLYVPSWFLEGDAVVAETALSNSGRGRIPDFTMELRTQLVEKNLYSYDKAVFGSYRHFTPDRYNLGYHIVAASRALFGPDPWNRAMNTTAKNPLIPNPFNRGIKRSTGLSQEALYKRCLLHLDSLWTLDYQELALHACEFFPIKESSEYCNYRFPAIMEDGSVFAVRSSIDDITRFVRIDSLGKVTTLFTPGNMNEDIVSFSEGKIYWTENIPDLRWENRNWSVVKIFDAKTQKVHQPAKKTRWYAPSPYGKKIAVVEITPANQVSLLIVDETTGNIFQRINTPENYLIISPSWDEKGESLVFIVQGPKGKAIAETDLQSGKVSLLTPFTTTEINKPFYYKEKVLFLGGYSGITSMYSLEPVSGDIKLEVSSRFGLQDARISTEDSSILYSDYSSAGYRIACLDSENFLSIPLKRISSVSLKLDSILSVQEGGAMTFDRTDIPYQVQPYRRILHLFNPHSWAPVFIDVDNTSLNPGLSLMSQDIMSTMFLSLGYQYNRYEQTGKYSADLSYKGWYPVISLTYSNGLRGSTYKPVPGAEDVRFTYEEQEIRGNISLPLNLTRNKYYRSILPNIGTTRIIRSRTPSSPERLILYDIESIDLGLTAYNILKYSSKDIFPRFGQILRFQRRTSFPGVSDSAEITAVSGELYFPGLMKHHSIRITGGYQEKMYSKYYKFGDQVRHPRGYNDQTGKGFYCLTFDYALPLAYPEISIPRFLYLKRISTQVFTDYARRTEQSKLSDYHSYGVEFMADSRLFRFYAPINLGCRTIFTPHSGKLSFEFMYSVNLASF
ncbi:MAG: hypothetical protein AB9842_01540 [Bacteroidales bacterium]